MQPLVPMTDVVFTCIVGFVRSQLKSGCWFAAFVSAVNSRSDVDAWVGQSHFLDTAPKSAMTTMYWLVVVLQSLRRSLARQGCQKCRKVLCFPVGVLCSRTLVQVAVSLACQHWPVCRSAVQSQCKVSGAAALVCLSCVAFYPETAIRRISGSGSPHATMQL